MNCSICKKEFKSGEGIPVDYNGEEKLVCDKHPRPGKNNEV